MILAHQFRVAALQARCRDDPLTNNGWITEAIAGMIDANETPDQAVIREAEEETGYPIVDPEFIGRFFSSPGGTSERIFLYFARTRERHRVRGNGVGEEDIALVHMPLPNLLARLDKGSIEDPKLVIASYWLKDRLRPRAEFGE